MKKSNPDKSVPPSAPLKYVNDKFYKMQMGPKEKDFMVMSGEMLNRIKAWEKEALHILMGGKSIIRNDK